jgi:hypothetical protein
MFINIESSVTILRWSDGSNPDDEDDSFSLCVWQSAGFHFTVFEKSIGIQIQWNGSTRFCFLVVVRLASDSKKIGAIFSNADLAPAVAHDCSKKEIQNVTFH